MKHSDSSRSDRPARENPFETRVSVSKAEGRSLSKDPHARRGGGAGSAPPPVNLRLPRFLVAHWRTGVVCLALTVGIGVTLIPILGSAYPPASGAETGSSESTLVGGATDAQTEGAFPMTTDRGEAECEPTETLLPEPDTAIPSVDSSPSENEADTAPAGEGSEASPAETTAGTAGGTEESRGDTETEGREPEVMGGTNSSETEAPPPEETTVPATPAVPAGCFPVIDMDVSRPELGVGYVDGDAQRLPAALPEGRLWSTAAPPTVLIVNTHPLEGYWDGGTYYDPASGGLSLVETPQAADGVVALSEVLTRALREQGVTVIHLRIAVSAEESAAEVYARTETTVRAYCRAYPEIGLVLDLRRSAELTAAGEILRTEGMLNGEPCAQVRLSVGGGRSKAALARDLAAALALRESLWELSPSLSRPVTVKQSGGLGEMLEGVCVVTLEAGSAGNTYDEAMRTVAPLARAIGELVLSWG